MLSQVLSLAVVWPCRLVNICWVSWTHQSFFDLGRTSSRKTTLTLSTSNVLPARQAQGAKNTWAQKTLRHLFQVQKMQKKLWLHHYTLNKDVVLHCKQASTWLAKTTKAIVEVSLRGTFTQAQRLKFPMIKSFVVKIEIE